MEFVFFRDSNGFFVVVLLFDIVFWLMVLLNCLFVLFVFVKNVFNVFVIFMLFLIIFLLFFRMIWLGLVCLCELMNGFIVF